MTTTRECRCSEFNRPLCEVRARRGLACLHTLPTAETVHDYMTFREAEALAIATGSVVRSITTLGWYGSPRKFYVARR